MASSHANCTSSVECFQSRCPVCADRILQGLYSMPTSQLLCVHRQVSPPITSLYLDVLALIISFVDTMECLDDLCFVSKLWRNAVKVAIPRYEMHMTVYSDPVNFARFKSVWNPRNVELYYWPAGFNLLPLSSTLTQLDISYAHNPENIDISILSQFINLISFRASNTYINDISAISHCSKLTDLCLTRTDVSDISALSCLARLKTLRFGYTAITDISSLMCSAPNITKLSLNNTDVDDISVLRACTRLEYLNLSHCFKLSKNDLDVNVIGASCVEIEFS